MSNFMDAMNSIDESVKQTASDIAAIHESFAKELLQKHGIETPSIDKTSVHSVQEQLEQKGYKLERVTQKDGDSEIYVWRLYKLADTSDKYRIKRAVAVEVDND